MSPARRQFIWPRLRRRFLWLALIGVFCQAVLPYFAAAQCPQLAALTAATRSTTAAPMPAHCGMALAAARPPAGKASHASPGGCALCATLALFGQATLAGPPPSLSQPPPLLRRSVATVISPARPRPPAAAFAARAPPMHLA